jgi:hypothetical protein
MAQSKGYRRSSSASGKSRAAWTIRAITGGPRIGIIDENVGMGGQEHKTERVAGKIWPPNADFRMVANTNGGFRDGVA